MKESDKNIENLIDKMMAENTLDSPSIDFTSNIMSQVLVAEKSKIKAYKPLISKSTWIFIGIASVALVVYSLFFAETGDTLQIEKLYEHNFSTLFSGIHFSKNIVYAILAIPFMMLIQIGLLKNYFDKKYEL